MEKCLYRFLVINFIMGKKIKFYTFLTALSVIFGLTIFQYLSAPAPSRQMVQSAQPATFGIEGEKALVIKVIDGDTIEINSGDKVRLIGIDTPETVDPRRNVGCFGKEASSEAKNLLNGKEIILQKDVSETDKYGRLLRYVYLPLEDGRILFVNDYLVREGFARIYTYPPDVKFNEQFLQAEKMARDQNKGLWKKC